MRRTLKALLVLLLGLVPLAAMAQPRIDLLRSSLSTEKQITTEARTRYFSERQQEGEAQTLATAALEALDSALEAQAGTPLAELRRLQIEVDAATVAARYATEQADEARRLLFQSRLREDALERQIRAILGSGGASDPVTGTWSVRIASPAEKATFELQLTGTLVAGTFAFEDGRSGSLRGTYAGGRLDLERIDANGGLAGKYLGTVDVRSGRANGLWSPNELSAGGPGITGWSAERRLPETDDENNATGTGDDGES